MSELVLQDLLKAGSHFGHQTHKWNPKMKKYIYGERNGIYILDLAQTVPLAKKAYDFLKNTAASGKTVLFVATKRQASIPMREAAEKCGAFFVTHRWLGGMLTNYKTVFLSIDKLRKVEKMKENGDFALLTKKEQSKIEKEIAKLERDMGGIKNMRKLPGALVVVDPGMERIAVNEAKTLGIPIVAIADTNCDPSGIDYVIPGNDDAIKSIALFANYFAESVAEGNQKASAARAKEEGGEMQDSLLEKEILTKYEKDIDLTLDVQEDEEA